MAINNFGFSIQFASERLRDNKNLALEAVKSSGYNLKYLSKRLKKDKSIVLKSLQKNAYSLKYADKSFKKNKTFLFKIFKFYLGGASFKYIHNDLKKDKKITLRALKTSGYAYKDLGKNNKLKMTKILFLLQ